MADLIALANPAAAARAAFEATPETVVFGDHSKCPRCHGKEEEDDDDDADRLADNTTQVAVHVLTAGEIGQLAEWDAAKDVNPKTGKKIAIGGPTHKKLTAEFQALRDSADPAVILRRNEDARAYAAAYAHERSRDLLEECHALTLSAIVRAETRETWFASVDVGADGMSCRQCDGDVTCAVTRTECQSHDGTQSRSCTCRCVWTAKCKPCGWTLAKPYASFTTSFETFATYARGD